MRQILYGSCSTVKGDSADLAGILQQSRHNNALDGISGLLWSDGRHFLQAIEGPYRSITATFDRIKADPRHYDITLLSDHKIETREFAGWNMVHRRSNDPDQSHVTRIERHLCHAPNHLKDHFRQLMERNSHVL